MKIFQYLLLLFLMIPWSFAFAQKQYVEFEHTGIHAGLSQSNVMSILQDSSGFMWFGTSDGLNRYDGYKFTVYKNDIKNPNSLSNNFIQAIAKSKNGDLWIATMGGGLCRYDRQKDQFIRFKDDLIKSNNPSIEEINSVLEDSKGQVWIGTKHGLDMFDINKSSFTHYRHNKNDKGSLSDDLIRNVFEDSDHNLWISTFGGLDLFDAKNKTFTTFQHNEENSKSISSNNIYLVFEDSKHRLWIGTNEDGLELFDKERGEFDHFKHNANIKNSLVNNAVRAICEDNEGNLWIGTENEGLSIFNPDKGIFSNYESDEFDNTSLGSNSINSIYKDTKGNIWIGTFNAGINLVSIDAGKFTHYKHSLSKNSLSHNKVLCIYEDSGKNIWVGTDGGGLNLFDPITGKFTCFKHEINEANSICGDHVLSVCEDRKGNLWIGTWGNGVTVFNRAKNTFKHFKNDPANSSSLSNNNAWAILEDKEKNIWIGTYGGGLNLFNPVTNSFTRYQYDATDTTGINDNWINNLYEDSEGNIWVSTTGGGLNLFDKEMETFTHFVPDAEKNSIGNISVDGICEDRNKNLWIGTMSGLNFLDKKTNKFTVYTTSDGLPSNVIFGILKDKKGNLWLSTNKGISMFNPDSKVFKNYGVSDGLQSNEFKENAYCNSSSGAMYFGGNNGFNQFFPNNIKTIAFEPPLVITNFQVFNKDVPIAKNENDLSPLKKNIAETRDITLSYKNSVFSFQFATLNYTATERKRYAYMLEGFDKSWNEVGTQRTATYTNLDAGKYVFKVKGLNNEGEWSSQMAKLQLKIIPPFWLTWWFKVVTFGIVIGSGLAIYRVRVKLIKLQKLVLQRQVQQQTVQLVHLNNEERKARLEAEQARSESEKAKIEVEFQNKELLKTNKELDRLVYSVSHDLRAPLNSVLGLVEFSEEDTEDSSMLETLGMIKESIKKLDGFILDILNYSKNSRQDVRKEEVNFRKMLQGITSNLQFMDMNKREVTVTLNINDAVPFTSDHYRVNMVLNNLISNAIRYQNPETERPVVNVNVDTSHTEAWIIVKDNGIGINKEFHAKVFDMFYRVSEDSAGSGLGLYIVKEAIDKLNGRIDFESELGKGTTFSIYIPNSN